MKRRGWLSIVAAGALLAATGTALVWFNLRRAPLPALGPTAPPLSATVLNDKEALPAFSFKRRGGRFANADVGGRWTLMFFGYTSCPDACPTALTLLRELKARLQAQGQTPPQVVLVSVDPRRDTPEVLARYVAAFDPDFIGAVGEDADLAPLAKHLGVMFARHDEIDRQNYAVDHSVGIYLIDKDARLRALFTPPLDAEAMARDYASLTR